ncbi:MAG TPA: hypothetical protein DCW44_05905 [Eubacterium sp.]|nr:hypothetical protein [Eubacterium sp.]
MAVLYKIDEKKNEMLLFSGGIIILQEIMVMETDKKTVLLAKMVFFIFVNNCMYKNIYDIIIKSKVGLT